MARPQTDTERSPRRSGETRITEVGPETRLDRARACVRCGHVIEVARVARLADGEYTYLCLGCAVKIR